jgi:hypothetical protein
MSERPPQQQAPALAQVHPQAQVSRGPRPKLERRFWPCFLIKKFLQCYKKRLTRFRISDTVTSKRGRRYMRD